MNDRSLRCTPPRVLRRLVPALALAAAAGCGPYVPDMTLDINFLDGSIADPSCDNAGVDTVTLDFLTGGLQGVQVPCTDAVSIVVQDVQPGAYQIRVQGLAGGRVRYSGDFDIKHTSGGVHRYQVDLAPTVVDQAVRFTFAGVGNNDGMTCAQAGVTRLDLTVGAQSFPNIPCSDAGANLQDVEPGTVAMNVKGYNAGGSKLYESNFPSVTIPTSGTLVLNVLALQKGGIELAWKVNGGACPSANVTFQLSTPAGTNLEAASLACASGALYANGTLDAGLYKLVGATLFSGGYTYTASNVALWVPSGGVMKFPIDLTPP